MVLHEVSDYHWGAVQEVRYLVEHGCSDVPALCQSCRMSRYLDCHRSYWRSPLMFFSM